MSDQSEHDLEKLLGGFAADTLTPEEKQQLYGAALQDQHLFNALADEQALKELMADPAVRRRLLQALTRTGASGAGGPLSWLDWLRRPAGLAFAGGLSAAALAVVLGIRIYQDSLRQAAPSVANEEANVVTPPSPVPPASPPSPPPAPEAQAPSKDNVLADKTVKREPSAPPALRKERDSENIGARLEQKREQDEGPGQTEAPAALSSKKAEDGSTSGDQTRATPSAPPATVPASTLTQGPAASPSSGAVAPTVSARALFYGEPASRSEGRATTQEREGTIKPLAESAPHTGGPKRQSDQLALSGKTAGIIAGLKPLGIRYGFVVRGAGGQDLEVDAATAAQGSGPVRLTVEANQDAYLQIWKVAGSSPPQLLFPEPDTGQISVRISVGRRQTIPLPLGSWSVSLFVRLSRVPLEPHADLNTPLRNRPALDRLQESNTARESIALQEHATYAVNREVFSDQLVVDIIKAQ